VSEKQQPALGVRKTGWGTLKVSGPDARPWLNGLITCVIERISAAEGAWGFLLNKRGKIVCDMTVLEHTSGLWLGTSFDVHALKQLLDSYLVMEDAELEVEPALSWLTLHGAGALVAADTGSVRARAGIGWTDGEAAALLLDEVAVGDYLARLSKRGAAELDADAWASLRVREGLPEFGVDFSSEDNPHEAALERRAVSFSKGCYMGQEVVCMQDMRGKVKRRLARVAAEVDQPWRVGTSVSASDGSEVGVITTADPLPSGAEFLAIARLKSPHFEPGSHVSVAGAPARVHALAADAQKAG